MRERSADTEVLVTFCLRPGFWIHEAHAESRVASELRTRSCDVSSSEDERGDETCAREHVRETGNAV